MPLPSALPLFATALRRAGSIGLAEERHYLCYIPVLPAQLSLLSCERKLFGEPDIARPACPNGNNPQETALGAFRVHQAATLYCRVNGPDLLGTEGVGIEIGAALPWG